MKFIYCMHQHLVDDFKQMGLKNIGTCKINGESITVFANDPKIMLNKYQKSAILLTNMMYFDTIIDVPKEGDVVEVETEAELKTEEVSIELKED